MNNKYQTFFGLGKEPFNADINAGDILKTPELAEVKDRFDYVVRLGAVGLVTGEVGSGKSTALRYAIEKLHPSEYRPLYITASSGSIIEFYRQFLDVLDMSFSSNSKAIMVKMIKKEIMNLVREKKMKIVLIVDEASLMRLEVFAELHTICQFEKDSKPYLPMILSGQNTLIDKLTYRSSQPLASRIVAKSHLEGVDLAGIFKEGIDGVAPHIGAQGDRVAAEAAEEGGRVGLGGRVDIAALGVEDDGYAVRNEGDGFFEGLEARGAEGLVEGEVRLIGGRIGSGRLDDPAILRDDRRGGAGEARVDAGVEADAEAGFFCRERGPRAW